MTSTKMAFLHEKMAKFDLSEREKNIVIRRVLQEWNEPFDFLLGKDIFPFLLEKGIPPQEAFSIMETLRKGNDLSVETKCMLMEQEGYLTFTQLYQQTLPTSHIGAAFDEFLTQKVQEVKRYS